MAALGGLLNEAAAALGTSVESEGVQSAAVQRVVDEPAMRAVRERYADLEELRGDVDLVARLMGVMVEVVASDVSELEAILARHGLKTDAGGDIVRA
jgi:hypothetical protein